MKRSERKSLIRPRLEWLLVLIPVSLVGDFVVQEEVVTGQGAPRRHVAVYHVEANRIRRERLIS